MLIKDTNLTNRKSMRNHLDRYFDRNASNHKRVMNYENRLTHKDSCKYEIRKEQFQS